MFISYLNKVNDRSYIWFDEVIEVMIINGIE
jgi:hypothetical protein